MIHKFGSLYAGHVDLKNIGFEGTPVNERWLSDEHLATVFDKATAIAQVMDKAGFDVIWLAEHHFQREGYECIFAVDQAGGAEALGLATMVRSGLRPTHHERKFAHPFIPSSLSTVEGCIEGRSSLYPKASAESCGTKPNTWRGCSRSR